MGDFHIYCLHFDLSQMFAFNCVVFKLWPKMKQSISLCIKLSFQVETEIRDEANLRFVFDTDVNSLINILETRGITK